MKKVLAFLLIVALCIGAVYFFTRNTDNEKKLGELFDDKKTDTQIPVGSNNNSDDEKAQTPEEDEKEDYVFPETEKQKLISKYIEAENFYYDMLCQNFELDNMDVITYEDNGYSTDYHRVLLVDVNSIAELKALYLGYFTNSFVESLDLSAYREENGKLYCAETATTANNDYAKYTCTAESADGKSAALTRKLTDGSSSQKITAQNSGGEWFFDGVAIR